MLLPQAATHMIHTRTDTHTRRNFLEYHPNGGNKKKKKQDFPYSFTIHSLLLTHYNLHPPHISSLQVTMHKARHKQKKPQQGLAISLTQPIHRSYNYPQLALSSVQNHWLSWLYSQTATSRKTCFILTWFPKVTRSHDGEWKTCKRKKKNSVRDTLINTEMHTHVVKMHPVKVNYKYWYAFSFFIMFFLYSNAPMATEHWQHQYCKRSSPVFYVVSPSSSCFVCRAFIRSLPLLLLHAQM